MPQSHDPHHQELTPTDAAEKFEEKMHDISSSSARSTRRSSLQQSKSPTSPSSGIPIPPGPLGVITEEEAKIYKAVCFAETTDEKKVAIIDPGFRVLRSFCTRLRSVPRQNSPCS